VTTSPIAIVPARGGSKRLPHKNLLEVGGRPMLAWPVAAALDSGLFAAVVVSTDDREITAAAQACGARVLDRPAALATDAATVAQVCLHTLETIAAEGQAPAAFCCLLPTAVFVTARDIADAYALLDAAPPADVVLGVSPYSLHPYKAMRLDEGYLRAGFPEQVGRKSQDYPAFVASNGTLFWARGDAFRRQPAVYVPRLKPYVMDPLAGQDLDTADDLARVRRLAPLFLGGKENHR
jgi:N-acylneuraminate cytidylyltransferase